MSNLSQDILPLLLAPSPALPLLAINSIQANHAQFHDLPAQAQMRSLVNAVRWDIGIDHRELCGSILEGERWFVQAAGAVRDFNIRCPALLPVYDIQF